MIFSKHLMKRRDGEVAARHAIRRDFENSVLRESFAR